MEAIRILIVEDEPIIAADLADRLTEMGFSIAGQYGSGEEALSELSESAPDLVLLDIKLEGQLDGIETAHKILEYRSIPVIFLTSNSDDATFARARTVLPAAFLSKPFRGKDLRHAIELAISRTPLPQPSLPQSVLATNAHYQFHDRIFIKTKDRMVRIFIRDILWVEADDYYCKVVTPVKEFLIGQTLKQFAEALTDWPEFLRVHRSYLVNLSHIEEIGDNHLVITKNKIPLSKFGKEEIIARFPRL